MVRAVWRISRYTLLFVVVLSLVGCGPTPHRVNVRPIEAIKQPVSISQHPIVLAKQPSMVTPTPTPQPTPVGPQLTSAGYPVSDGTIYWTGDFETGDTSQWGDVHAGGVWGNSSAQIVTSPVRQGKYAIKLTVSPGGSDRSGERAELSASQINTDGYPNHSSYYSWSTYVPSVPNVANGWSQDFTDITQWMDLYANCSPPLQIDISPDNPPHYILDSEPRDNQNGCSALAQFQNWDLGMLHYDQWTDFTVLIYWSTDPSVGYAAVWINGRNVFPLTHMRTLDTSGGVYMEQALYRGHTNFTNVVYLDATRRHSSL